MKRYVTPLKASSVRFDPQGVWRGVVTGRNGNLVDVRVPRLSGELEYTSVETVSSGQLVVGDPVLVGFIEGLQDELVVIGRLNEPVENTSITADTKDVPTTIDKVSLSAVRSVKYVVVASYDGYHRVSEILAVHDGTNASFTEYGVVFTPTATTPMVSYDVSVAGGVMVLTATPSFAGMVFTVSRTVLVV